MKIRNRLLYLLLPPLIAFVALSAVFFYYQWRNEILATFRIRLEAVVATAAKGINGQNVASLFRKRIDGSISKQPLFLQLEHQLRAIAQAAAIDSLFIASIEDVKPGERVLLDEPASGDNPVYEGTNSSLAHRQVYLIDVTPPHREERSVGSYDFSESEEHLIYYNRQPMVTPAYTARYGGERVITAYAPILDDKDSVVALIGADVSMASVDKKLQRALFSLIASALATVVLVSLSVFFAANKISQPVQKLKNAALDIAAGEYDTSITVTEPQEIAELANTLNTMSACLKENIERLRQNATARERLLGEYECALLLQKRMFQKACEGLDDPHLLLQGLCSDVAPQPHGIYVTWEKNASGNLSIIFYESMQQGFDSLYNLLQGSEKQNAAKLQMNFNWIENSLNYTLHGMPMPMIWTKSRLLTLAEAGNPFFFEKGDVVIAVSNAWHTLFSNENDLQKWLLPLLTHFGQESFPLFTKMAQKEITFQCDHSHLDKDFFVLIIRLL